MGGRYDQALRRYRQTSPYYGRFGDGPGFANHGPMVVEVLHRLGRDGDIGPWTDGYIGLLKPRPAEAQPITAADWQTVLGDWSRVGDWLAFFEREVGVTGWQYAVRTWLPRLLPGPDMLGHGPIRLFHVIRALSDDVTDERILELGDALAYWAASYDASFVVRDVPAPEGILAIERELDAVIRDSAWAYMACPTLRPIVMAHSVTAPRAIRDLLPWLPAGQHPVAFQMACSLTQQIVAPYRAPLPEIGASYPDERELVDRALASGDDHAIKLTEACLSQHARQPAPVFLAAAADVSQRLRADWL